MNFEHLDTINYIAKELLKRGIVNTREEAEEIARKWVIESETDIYFS